MSQHLRGVARRERPVLRDETVSIDAHASRAQLFLPLREVADDRGVGEEPVSLGGGREGLELSASRVASTTASG